MKDIQEITKGWEQSFGHFTSYLGEPKYSFITLCSGGLKKECESTVLYTSEEMAIEDYIAQLRSYLSYSDPLYTLYWREEPSIVRDDTGMCFVRSRLMTAPKGLKNPDTMNTKHQLSRYLQPGWRTEKKGPNPENTSGFRATGHRVLLVPEEVEEVTLGGIVLVQKTVHAEAQRAVVCTVLEIGPDAWADKSTDYCELGDRVLIGQYVGKFHESPVDGKTYRFVSDLDIISPLPRKE